MNGESELHPIPTSFLMVKRMAAIGIGRGLHPSEFFSYDKEYHHERRKKNSTSVGLGNDAISKALNQIFRSPFTCWIEGRRLHWRFTQPTFTMYSGRTDPVEHVTTSIK